MKVLHFFKTYYPDTYGGVEQVIYQLAEGGRKLGIDAEVLSLSPRGSSRDVPFANHITHQARLDLYLASTGFSLSAFQDFKELASQADIIHYHFPWPFMDLVHFFTGTKKPTVVTYHSDIVKQKTLLKLYSPLMYKFLNSVDRIVATSPNYNSTSSVLQQYQSKVDIIPIGLDSSDYPESSNSKLAEWSKKLSGPFFLLIGTLRYYKGLHILLDAMTTVDLPIAIVGSGPLESQLKIRCNEIGLKNVHFLGSLSNEDKNALLSLSYGVIFPSHLRAEAFGISLLEGAIYGKPLISCEVGSGTTYVNINEVTGLVVPPDNPLELRKAMLKLWNDPVLASDLGRQAKSRYETYFTAELMVKKYAELYQSII